MTKKQIEKYLAFQSYLSDINHEWWNQQIIETLSEIECIESQSILNKKQTKRLLFLQSRLDYLTKKSHFERKSVKNLNKKIKTYYKIYG